MNALGNELDCARSPVNWTLEHGLKPPGHRGNHIDPDQHLYEQILDWIPQNREPKARITKKRSEIKARVNHMLQ
jgi:hypothetical protein